MQKVAMAIGADRSCDGILRIRTWKGRDWRGGRCAEAAGSWGSLCHLGFNGPHVSTRRADGDFLRPLSVAVSRAWPY